MGPDTFSKFQAASWQKIGHTVINADVKRRKNLKYMTFIFLSIYNADDLMEIGI
jgi:hypothetical protein